MAQQSSSCFFLFGYFLKDLLIYNGYYDDSSDNHGDSLVHSNKLPSYHIDNGDENDRIVHSNKKRNIQQFGHQGVGNQGKSKLANHTEDVSYIHENIDWFVTCLAFLWRGWGNIWFNLMPGMDIHYLSDSNTL